MLISYYEDGSVAPYRLDRLLLALMLLNAAFAGVILFAWTYVALFVAGPLEWATWMPIHRGYGVTGVFEYPFILFWLMPLIGVFGGWVGHKGNRRTMAYAFVAIPITMLAAIMVCYYLAPPDWR